MLRRAGQSILLLVACAAFAPARGQVPASSNCAAPASGSAAQLPWEIVVERIDCDRTRLVSQLAQAHSVLVRRAELEAPALLPRLKPEPATAVATGYGLFPEITANFATRGMPLAESRFSLRDLLGAAAADEQSGRALAARADSSSRTVATLVTEYERLRERLRNLESNINYHRFWQKSAAGSEAFFARKNELVLRARELRRLEQQRDTVTLATLRNNLAADVAPFTRTASLEWRMQPDGARVLTVEVITDIVDEAFLKIFSDAVEQTWNDSNAARARRFRIDLRFSRITPAQLYEQRAPVTGSLLVEADHIARFPRGRLVLTTGAKSTHASRGHYVQIGTSPISPRVLAHEFGHLLGFDDGYLRGTEGTSTDAFGYTLVEWTGILDDLMGAPGYGLVTDQMIERLIESYRPGF